MFFRFKMASFYCLIAVVFSIVCCSTPAFAQENTTFQPGNNTSVGCKINTNASNKKSNSTECKLLIDPPKIEEVLSKHDNSTTTNTVKIKISVVPGINTRYSQELELPWASNIGRTIISLVRRAKGSIFTSPIFTWMLEVGTEEVDIRVKEETDGCLPPGDKGSDLIFDTLLRQLSHSEDMHVFKLCREHDDHAIQYNCCRIVGEKNLAICADYSSAVVNVALPILIIVVLISFFMILPFVLEYIRKYPKITFYKTSDSPMSLRFIISKIFCEGREPAMSLIRRCVFVGLSVVVFVPNFFGHLWLLILFCCWAVVFVLVYDGDVMEEVNSEQKSEKLGLDEKIISALKAPFSVFFVHMLEFYKSPRKCLHKSRKCRKISESECCKRCSDSKCKCCSCCKCGFLRFIILVLYILIVLPLWICFALLKFALVDFLLFFVIMHDKLQFWSSFVEQFKKTFKVDKCCSCLRKTLYVFTPVVLLLLIVMNLLKFIALFVIFTKKRNKWLKFICKCSMRLLTFANIVFFTGMIPIFALSIVVGLTLNAEYFSPFAAPILTLIVFFWKNWKFSVEGKCLQLKTLIIEVYWEKLRATKDRQNSENNRTSVEAQERPVTNDGQNDMEDSEDKQVSNKDNLNENTTSNDDFDRPSTSSEYGKRRKSKSTAANKDANSVAGSCSTEGKEITDKVLYNNYSKTRNLIGQ